MPTELAIVILNYRTPELTIDCLASLSRELEPGIRVVVVDNASGDRSPDAIEEAIRSCGWSGWTTVLRSPVNGGFAAGNNFGVRAVEAAAYLLLNSDTIVRPGALRSLRRALVSHPEAGVIGAGLLNPGGDPAYSHFRFAVPLSEFLRGANTGPITRMLTRFDPILPLTESPAESEWVSFAGVLIRREVFQSIGALDEGYFMYFEDVDFCRRAAAAGWKILYWPEAKIVHLAGGSSGGGADAERGRAPGYYYQARARYFAKYHGRAGLWLANLLWYAGRSISFVRELFGRVPSHRDRESLDIWINALRPLRPGKRADASVGRWRS